MDYLEQRYLFNKIRVDFTDTGVLYTYGNIFNTKQLAIDYEEIIFWKVTRTVKTDKFNLFVCIASALVMLKSIMGIYDNPYGIYKGLLPFSTLFFIVFFVVTFLGRIKYLYIETTDIGAIKLFDRKRKSVDSFLAQLSTNSRTYLREKYTEIDSNLSKEVQLENLFWLKSIKVITKQEYDAFKNQLINNNG